MKKVQMFSILGLLVLSTSAMAERGGSSSVGGGHPSVAYCESVGGEIFSLKGRDGTDYSMCRFDRGMIESVTLWSSQASAELALKAFYAHIEVTIPVGENPSKFYCEASGGQMVIGLDSQGNEWGLCQFNDQGRMSLIDGWTLFRGPLDPLNAGLMKALAL